jgi:hypothetical protein
MYASTLQDTNDVPREVLLDFPMPGHWLRHACPRVLIPIVLATMSEQDAALLLDLTD